MVKKPTLEPDIISVAMRYKSNALILVSVLSVIFIICCFACGSREIPKNKIENIAGFLKDAVKVNREEDYRSHGINISVHLTGLKIERITRRETAEDYAYFVQGKASYVITGKRRWEDKDGNIIELEPEQEITHWFSCGILEDKFIGVLFKDNKNRLTFYADSPIR